MLPLIPPVNTGGRPRSVEIRDILTAIFYVLRSGWVCVANAALRESVREQAGREAEPSAGSLESQRVKTTETKGARGYDAKKKVTGRKRHILVDVMGLLLVVLVHNADSQERAGAHCCYNVRSRKALLGSDLCGRMVAIRERISRSGAGQ